MIKFILKVFGTQVFATIVLILTSPLVLISENGTYQTAVSLLMMLFYWAFICFMLEKTAVSDIKDNKFNMVKPIVGAFVANIPNIVMIITDALYTNISGERDQLVLLVFRWANAGYMNFLINYKDPLWLMAMIVVANVIVICFAYYRAKIMDNKQKTFMSNLTKEMEGVHKAVDLPPDDIDD